MISTIVFRKRILQPRFLISDQVVRTVPFLEAGSSYMQYTTQDTNDAVFVTLHSNNGEPKAHLYGNSR